MDVFLSVVDDLEVFLVLTDFLEQLDDLLTLLGHSKTFATVGILLLAVIVNLKNVQDFLLLVVLLSELIQFLFIFTDSAQELSVCLLPREELVNHFLHISIACRCSDFLECIFQVSILIHFVVHLLFQELTPKFLDLEVSSGSELALISVLVGSCFSDFLLFLNSINSFLKGLFLIFDTILQTNNTLIPLFLLMLNILHKVCLLYTSPSPRD